MGGQTPAPAAAATSTSTMLLLGRPLVGRGRVRAGEVPGRPGGLLEATSSPSVLLWGLRARGPTPSDTQSCSSCRRLRRLPLVLLVEEGRVEGEGVEAAQVKGGEAVGPPSDPSPARPRLASREPSHHWRHLGGVLDPQEGIGVVDVMGLMLVLVLMVVVVGSQGLGG